MKDKSFLIDLYTDYLICGTGLATSTGLSKIVNNDISHDKFTRMLSECDGNSKYLWLNVKPLIRKVEKTADGFIILDDTIEEKEYSDENDIIRYHFSHAKHRHVKGINILTAVVRYGEISLPIDYHIVKKTIPFTDKNNKLKHKSEVNKNEVVRGFIANAIINEVKFAYVLADIWFSCSENMNYVHSKKKHFIFGCKSNRLVRFNNIWHKLSDLPLSDGQVIQCYIKGVDFPVAITKKVFINEDLSTGELYLISNKLDLSGIEMYSIYQKRWSIEEFHKSIKQNASLAKSPTKIVKTQSNHIFCSMLAFVKLETLRLKTQMNHFAIKSKLYINAVRSALDELAKLRLTLNMQTTIC